MAVWTTDFAPKTSMSCVKYALIFLHDFKKRIVYRYKLTLVYFLFDLNF